MHAPPQVSVPVVVRVEQVGAEALQVTVMLLVQVLPQLSVPVVVRVEQVGAGALQEVTAHAHGEPVMVQATPHPSTPVVV